MADDEQTRYDRYVEEICDDIAETVQSFGCQPILFVGSGLTKRYMDAPNWDELLAYLGEKCTDIEKGLAFYKQSYQTPMNIGEEFAKLYQGWAWGKATTSFRKNSSAKMLAHSHT